MFFAVEGEEQRGDESPSWFNVAELTAVNDLVASLKADSPQTGDGRVKNEDIGECHLCTELVP